MIASVYWNVNNPREISFDEKMKPDTLQNTDHGLEMKIGLEKIVCACTAGAEAQQQQRSAMALLLLLESLP